MRIRKIPFPPLMALWIAFALSGCSAGLLFEDPEPGPGEGGVAPSRPPARGDATVAPPAADANTADTGTEDAAALGVDTGGPPGECRDEDGDGHSAGCPEGTDCDDGDPLRHRGARERCNDLDDDCDGLVDETFALLDRPCEVGVGACARAGVWICAGDGVGVTCPVSQGDPGPETCNGVDDDCDGPIDEGVADCCTVGDALDCGASVGACRTGQQRCGAGGRWAACEGGVGPGPEICDGLDNDCDGQVDEGVLNACGVCGPAPDEVCNGRDDDCDGRIGEGVLNACDACGPTPDEICNGLDDDCDGAIDERACGVYVLLDGEDRWTRRIVSGPYAAGEAIEEGFGSADGASLWILTAQHLYPFDTFQQRFESPLRRDDLFPSLRGRRVRIAHLVPSWWARLEDSPEPSSLMFLDDRREAHIYTWGVDATARFIETRPIGPAWETPHAPPDLNAAQGSMLDLFNRGPVWAGDASQLCEAGEARLGPTLAVLADGRFYPMDVGWCWGFAPPINGANWPLARLVNAPDLRRVAAPIHLNDRAGRPPGGYYFFERGR